MRPVEVIPGAFRVTITGNEGAIWGIGKKYSRKYKRPFFIALSFVAMGFVLWLFFDTTREQWPRRLGLGLVLSGAVGNLIDRIRLDYVIDFLDWYLGFNWPTFNVADIAISVGVGLVIVDLFWHPNPVPPEEVPGDAPPEAAEAPEPPAEPPAV
jgi:signal peptidase II